MNFFEFALKGLNGFAGIDGIYIGINSISMFIRDLPKCFNIRQKFEIFKLNLTRLIVHEMCHVVLRRVMKDFNVSSPSLTGYKQNAKVGELIEAGVIAEKQIFSERINWAISAKMQQFNLGYCTDFLNELFNLTINDEYPIEYPPFDFKKSGCILNTSKIVYMAIDYSEEEKELI